MFFVSWTIWQHSSEIIFSLRWQQRVFTLWVLLQTFLSHQQTDYRKESVRCRQRKMQRIDSLNLDLVSVTRDDRNVTTLKLKVIRGVHRWRSLSRTQPVTSRWPWRLCLKETGLESRLWKGETHMNSWTHEQTLDWFQSFSVSNLVSFLDSLSPLQRGRPYSQRHSCGRRHMSGHW